MAKGDAKLLAERLRAAATIVEMLGDDPEFSGNTTINSLVDDYCILSACETGTKKLKELHKGIIASKNVEDKKALMGEKFLININTSSRANFSKEKAAQFLTAEQMAECTTSTEVTTWKTAKLQ